MQRLTEYFNDTEVDAVGERLFNAVHDGVVHIPLGAAAYIYEKELAKPLLRALRLVPFSATLSTLSKDGECAPPLRVDAQVDPGASASPDTASARYIHVGAQPNNTPHAGTIVTFALAFLLARHLQDEYPKLRARALALPEANPALWVADLRVVVQLDLVDTAPDIAQTEVRGGVVYQRSHRATGAVRKYLQDYHDLLAELDAFVEGEVKYVVRDQEELMRMPGTRDAVRAIILDRERIACDLAPEREVLAMRSACPVDGCGLADKHGVRNAYAVDAESTSPDDLARLVLNTPLRSLARTLVYMVDTAESRLPGQTVPARLHMRVTGSDYAGEYQERMLFRQLTELRKVAEPTMREVMGDDPLFVYSPLIVDWSGAKLSKSLYVVHNAYGYLFRQGKDYLLEYRRMVEGGKDRRVLFKLVEEWIREPAKRYRSYSLEYLHLLFVRAALLGNNGGQAAS